MNNLDQLAINRETLINQLAKNEVELAIEISKSPNEAGFNHNPATLIAMNLDSIIDDFETYLKKYLSEL